jgi:cellulose biosynthesis protein BcsQ
MADALKKVVSVLLQKGGVGKTAVTANTAFEAARLGLNVLFVDSDPTGYGSELLTDEGYLDGLTLSDCVAPGGDKLDVRGEVVRRAWGGWQPTTDLPWADGGALGGGPVGRLDVLPSDPSLSQKANANGSTALRSLFRVLHRGCGRPLVEDYDMVFIDCQPSPDLASQMSVLASGWLLMVVLPESMAASRGLSLALQFTTELAVGWDHDIAVGGVIINSLNASTREHREVAEGIQVWVDDNIESDGDIVGRVWGSPVGRSTAVSKAMSARQPISASLIEAARGGRLARLGIGKTHRRPVAQFAQFALNAATLTCPDKVGDLKARLTAEPMPDIMRAVLNNSALADVHAIAVGE